MKKILLPITTSYSLSFGIKELEENEKVTMPNGMKGVNIGGISTSKYNDDLICARDNGARIIWATSSIEKKLEDLVAKYLFTIKIGIVRERDFFINEIISSSR